MKSSSNRSGARERIRLVTCSYSLYHLAGFSLLKICANKIFTGFYFHFFGDAFHRICIAEENLVF